MHGDLFYMLQYPTCQGNNTAVLNTAVKAVTSYDLVSRNEFIIIKWCVLTTVFLIPSRGVMLHMQCLKVTAQHL